MKLAALMLLVPILAFGADCETVSYQQSPVTSIPKARRVYHPKPHAHTIPGPRKHTPTHIVPRAEPATPSYRRVVSRYDCPPPASKPPGGWSIPGVPFIGSPPVWGYPFPVPPPTGPQPVWPGTPNDFPPALTIPPGLYYPPQDRPPVDVPEPPTIALLLFGISILVARRYMK